ncbi:hypothetical protein [Sandarakinorhabdus sp.]|uniref:hypothetical protein n=1 Tax=Sandarakinorhabdus sp. TaxID=1916663 RepID=UPI00286E9FA4|nr:hypothetical protein [Sandarakinorhabdus sp.]
MRNSVALFLAVAICTGSSAFAQQDLIKGAAQRPPKNHKSELADVLRPVDSNGVPCPVCLTPAQPQVLLSPPVMRAAPVTMADPVSATACPAPLDAEQTAQMKSKLMGLLNGQTVKLLEEKAAKEACPEVALALDFARIVLGDDVSITKKKP